MERARERGGTHPLDVALALKLALDQLSKLGELVPRVQRRCGREAELEVGAATGLAELGGRGREVEHVVDELRARAGERQGPFVC